MRSAMCRALCVCAVVAAASVAASEVQADMEIIPRGVFQMGRHVGDGGDDEHPIHSVYVDSFRMDRTEVTNQQYADALNWALSRQLIYIDAGVVYSSGGTAYCDTTSSSSQSRITWDGSAFGVEPGAEDHPMLQVSWYGAAAYSNWRSEREGRTPSYDPSTWECNFSPSGYRLPTEAEWEYAARGGLHSPYCAYPWGDDIDGSKANYIQSGDPYDEGTTPVGYYDANGYGLYDMSGNVYEWCNDWYDSDYYSSSPPENPRGPATGGNRVLRGGSCYSSPSWVRCAERGVDPPNYRGRDTGIRLALSGNGLT